MATFDIHYEMRPTEEQRGGKLFTFAFQRAIGVKGPQKLINRWLKCFLTTKGSDPITTDYGTGFQNLFNSNASNLADVADLVSIYVDDCNAQIRKFDRLFSLPANERLQYASIESITPLGADGIEVRIQIRNQAGESYVTQLPTLTAA